MDVRLYAEAKAIVDPFAYDEYRKEKIEKMLEEGTAKRIRLKKAARALPKVREIEKERAGEKKWGRERKRESARKRERERERDVYIYIGRGRDCGVPRCNRFCANTCSDDNGL